jgi:hypothetical protein
MSWDIIVLDLPPGITSINQIPKNFKPRPLGLRSDFISRISTIFPETNFSDPSWGILRASGCSIEFNMGTHENVDSFAMHVRGGEECPDVVARILDGLEVRALDTSSPSGLFEQDPALRSKGFERWRSFSSHVQDLLDNSHK